jgi:hypothetical protein
MSVISPSEFEEWQNHFITKEFYEAVINRIDDAKDILSESAGMDSDQDNFYRGFIHAYREVLSFRVDSPTEEN